MNYSSVFFLGVLFGHGIMCLFLAYIARSSRSKINHIKINHIKGSYVIPIKRY